jgi:membrane protein CcdC involved in cytochrome C biogenesis
MQPATIVVSVVGAAAVLAWRVRETQRPVTARNLLAPPLGMSTGFCMFLVPETHVPPSWALIAFAAGALLFSYPLVLTSRLTKTGDTITLQRSKAFLWILLALFGVRLAARGWVEEYVSTMQTGALFFVLAFGMILPWRLTLYLHYRRLLANPSGAARSA